MGLPIYVAYCRNPHLLDRCLHSLGKHVCDAIVIDNSHEVPAFNDIMRLGRTHLPLICNRVRHVVRPNAPLNVAQFYYYVWMQNYSHLEQDTCILLHDDAYLTSPDVIDKLHDEIRRAHDLYGTKGWAYLLTLYDKLCAVNTYAMLKVNIWPDLQLPVYGVDCDIRRQCNLKDVLWLDAPALVPYVQHPEQSPNLHNLAHSKYVQYYNHTAYYVDKWGGLPGEETHRTPWNQ